ncbi:MAG: ribose 5-phosphate isomerase B [Rickettsiales bacterium]|jgi:ribose 5-phosphate isomerase B|nr:ribose 5-phosphate isomerase B [Rickettsiales bacterium]
MTIENIIIASDRAGFELKSFLMEKMRTSKDYHFVDFGTDGDEAVDYPDYARKVAMAILAGEANYGILICGTGIGMSMAANRFRGIRAGLCHGSLEARLTREHNDANILCLGARIIGNECALENVNVFLSTKFSGGRHSDRIRKLDL